MRSARRNGIARSEETCEREREGSNAGSQVSALNDGNVKQSEKAGACTQRVQVQMRRAVVEQGEGQTRRLMTCVRKHSAQTESQLPQTIEIRKGRAETMKAGLMG